MGLVVEAPSGAFILYANLYANLYAKGAPVAPKLALGGPNLCAERRTNGAQIGVQNNLSNLLIYIYYFFFGFCMTASRKIPK